MWKNYQAALMMFSRLPLPYQQLEQQHFTQSLNYLPLVGLAIGVIASLVFSIVQLFFPSQIALVFAFVAGIIATGALHEDGFADCCDGFGAGQDKESILRMMRDSSNGSYASLGLAVLFASKLWFAIYVLPEMLIPMLICMHIFARFVPLWIVKWIPHCNSGEHKMSQGLNLDNGQLYLFFIISLLLLAFTLSFSFMLAMAVTVLFLAWLCSRFFMRRLQGYSGDCLGAAEQLAECAVLLLFIYYF